MIAVNSAIGSATNQTMILTCLAAKKRVLLVKLKTRGPGIHPQHGQQGQQAEQAQQGLGSKRVQK